MDVYQDSRRSCPDGLSDYASLHKITLDSVMPPMLCGGPEVWGAYNKVGSILLPISTVYCRIADTVWWWPKRSLSGDVYE
jgi:hypothetical protein